MRSAFDKFISWTGLLMAVVLLLAGGLLWWAHTFIGDQVNDQLTMQGITMPEGDALSGLPKADADALKPYAGSQLDTGPEAKAFANHYILVHMNEASDGKTYSEVSGEYMGAGCSDPANASSDQCQQLGGLRATLFQGSTLRGLLLYGYAFDTIGRIAFFASIGAYIAGALLLVLGLLGFSHAKKAAAAQA